MEWIRSQVRNDKSSVGSTSTGIVSRVRAYAIRCELRVLTTHTCQRPKRRRCWAFRLNEHGTYTHTHYAYFRLLVLYTFAPTRTSTCKCNVRDRATKTKVLLFHIITVFTQTRDHMRLTSIVKQVWFFCRFVYSQCIAVHLYAFNGPRRK